MAFLSLSIPQNLLSEARHSDGSYCALATAPASAMPHPISFHPRNKNCILIGQLDWSLIRQPGFGSHESRPHTHPPYPSSTTAVFNFKDDLFHQRGSVSFAAHLQCIIENQIFRVWEEGNLFKILGLMTTISFGLWVQMGLISAITTYRFCPCRWFEMNEQSIHVIRLLQLISSKWLQKLVVGRQHSRCDLCAHQESATLK